MQVRGYGCFIEWNAERWSRYGISPIWLCIKGPVRDGGWDRRSEATLRALAAAKIEFRPDAEWALVPLRLKLHAERDAVVEHAYAQILGAIKALPELPPAAASTP